MEEITTHPELGTLAPQAEISKPAEYKSSVRLLIEKLIQRDEERKAVQTEPVSIPTIQATTETTQESCRQPVQTPSNACRSVAPAASDRPLAVKSIVRRGKERAGNEKGSAAAPDSRSGKFSGSRNPGQYW